jgi:hypothetical protein
MTAPLNLKNDIYSKMHIAPVNSLCCKGYLSMATAKEKGGCYFC